MSIFLKIAEYLNESSPLTITQVDSLDQNDSAYLSQTICSNPNKKQKIHTSQWVLTNDLYSEYKKLITDNNSLFLKIEKLLNGYMLEKKMLALDIHLYLAYIYVSLSKKLFCLKFINNNKTIELINSIDENDIITNQLKRKLAIIHETFDYQKNYFVRIDNSLALPWNDFILPTLMRHSLSKNNLVNDLELPSMSYNKSTKLINKVSIENRKLELYSIGNAIYRNDNIILNTQLFGKINESRIQHFINNTLPVALSINGTACSYKTTFINNCLSEIKNQIDPNARILKIGKMGKFKGKDSNQVLAMNYQYMISSLVHIYYTSLFDRCKFNNMIWRIILACMNTNKDPVMMALNKLLDFTPHIINQMKMEPIIIFIDLNKIENRKRMNMRNKGSDKIRASIENYVSAQNIVYGLLAYLCDWPIFPANLQLHSDIAKFIITKIKKNVSAYSETLPPICEIPDHELCFSKNIDYDKTFDHSKYLKIFK